MVGWGTASRGLRALHAVGRQRSIVAGLFVVLMISGFVFLFWPIDRPGAASVPSPAPSSPLAPVPSGTPPAIAVPTAVPGETDMAALSSPVDLSPTRDFRALAVEAARGIYTWDSRSSSYSDVYARVRSWWELLPDGSNPLSVLVKEFEATGVTPTSFASLGQQSARRSAKAQSVRCDLELSKVQEFPPPWAGLHVCTVIVQVLDETSRDRNTYSAPITVMLNCPPAATAPADRCAMVAFYATADRIVY
ncbi:hypothetical protein J2T23_000581 [Pseudarthrobacter niigatensis]|uniref:Uncharacterized protein n=1 Tax=Pseudarthrobacter niigatensis TaxID=369935 RepID=A0AAJ1SVV3_9MICC|nr:hypothetical protein [Pseudarthrobacter niigatensis]MDQ0265353.1 hypothetical protein [Pseudarthrobacter niigatensis]